MKKSFTGTLKFKAAQNRAYTAIYDEILESIAETHERGNRTITFTRFPPLAMYKLIPIFEEDGYDVQFKLLGYGALLQLFWHEPLDEFQEGA